MNDSSGAPGWVLVVVVVAGLLVGAAAVLDVDLSTLWAAVTEP